MDVRNGRRVGLQWNGNGDDGVRGMEQLSVNTLNLETHPDLVFLVIKIYPLLVKMEKYTVR